MAFKKTLNFITFVGFIGTSALAATGTSEQTLETPKSNYKLGIDASLSTSNGAKASTISQENELSMSYKLSDDKKIVLKQVISYGYETNKENKNVEEGPKAGPLEIDYKTTLLDEKESSFGIDAEVRNYISFSKKTLGSINPRITFSKSFFSEDLTLAIQFSEKFSILRPGVSATSRSEFVAGIVAYNFSDSLGTESALIYNHSVLNKKSSPSDQIHKADLIINPLVFYKVSDDFSVYAQMEAVAMSEDDEKSGFAKNWLGEGTYGLGMAYTF